MKISRPLRAASAAAAAMLATASLTACSESADNASGNGANVDPTDIVATTNVWADVASAVTGNDVEAIISNTSIDPHHYEPAAKDLARISNAGTVVANGGHYDSSLYTVAEQDRIIHAVPLNLDGTDEHNHDHGDHGHAHDDEHAHDEHDHAHNHGDHNHGEHDHDHGSTGLPQDIDELEHVWMSPAKVKEVAKAVQDRVGGDAGDVDKRMTAIEDRLTSLPHVHLGMTETIGLPLIQGTELHDITPEPYMLASLNHAEPAVSDVAAFLEKIDSGVLDLIIVNPQSTNSATERLLKAAEDNDVPVVEIRETPPEGMDFLDYFEQVVDEIAQIAEKAEPSPEAEIDRDVN